MDKGVGLAGTLQWTDSAMLVALRDRTGLGGEQFRRMSIRLGGLKETLGGGLQVILVTSPMMGDGKTATAANLALTLAQEEGRKVVLIDCDTRKPRLWSLFRDPPKLGLSDVLCGGPGLAEVTRRTEGAELDVVVLPRGSAGKVDPLPVERLKGVLRALRQRYDFVICDAPPILPIADADVLGRLADGLVLVVRAGMTPREAVTRSLDRLDRKKLIGFVLNGVAEKTIERYYYRYHADDGGGRGARNGQGA